MLFCITESEACTKMMAEQRAEGTVLKNCSSLLKYTKEIYWIFQALNFWDKKTLFMCLIQKCFQNSRKKEEESRRPLVSVFI